MADRDRASSLKRSFPEDDDADAEADADADAEAGKPSQERKVRFPKGKKAKRVNEAGGNEDKDAGAFGRWMNPELAARERSKRRSQNRENDLFKDQVGGGGVEDIARAEMHYEVNASFEDDGIEIEPFNLKQEREEGYFDTEGNYVEYVATNEIKDAWLDNVEVDPKLAEKYKESQKTTKEEEYDDLSSKDIGKIKRRIADALQPRETVIQALKRLKGTSGNKKDKMPEETKRAFDQLTEDAMKLMESGEYNVYYEKQETFEREAEGYERLAHAREGTSRSTTNGSHEFVSGEDIFSDGVVAENPSHSEVARGSLHANEITTNTSVDDDMTFDMFGDEDENTTTNPDSDMPSSEPPPEASGSLQNLHPEKAGEGNETDYVFDESSGYYYSSSLGYYYDPASALYCCAASGTWYSFNEQTGAYDEIEADGSRQTAEHSIGS